MPPMLVESFATEDMEAAARHELLAMLASAYGEDLERYLLDAGAGWHWIGRVDGALASTSWWLRPKAAPASRAYWRTTMPVFSEQV